MSQHTLVTCSKTRECQSPSLWSWLGTCCPTQISKMATCTWDLDSGSLTTHWETTEENNRVVLEMATWFKDAFANLGLTTNGQPKKTAPPPETLFNLKEDWLVKAMHHRHKEQQAATTAGTTPPLKGNNKIVDAASSDKDSASSSSQDRLRATDAVGDEDSPTLSAEDDGNAVGMADGG